MVPRNVMRGWPRTGITLPIEVRGLANGSRRLGGARLALALAMKVSHQGARQIWALSIKVRD